MPGGAEDDSITLVNALKGSHPKLLIATTGSQSIGVGVRSMSLNIERNPSGVTRCAPDG